MPHCGMTLANTRDSFFARKIGAIAGIILSLLKERVSASSRNQHAARLLRQSARSAFALERLVQSFRQIMA
jgi:hypothetical protein